MPRLRIHLNGAEIESLHLNAANSYLAGRAAGCQIPLGDHPGISRQHFRILMVDGQWTVQVMSKFGELQINGQSVTEATLEPGTLFRVPPYDFFFLDDSVTNSEADSEFKLKSTDRAPNPANALAPYTGPQSSSSDESSEVFDGSEEKTMVGQLPAVAYVKVTGADGTEDTFRLEGNLWVAGRDETCEIALDDLKSSRRQFELASTPEGYFITDLDSSNGTLLNGAPLTANQPTEIRSGDIIGVGGVTITFELRDPNFKDKLVVIRPDVMKNPLVLTPQGPANGMAYPFPYDGPGGVVPLDPHGHGSAPAPRKGLDFRQPKTKILAAVALTLLVFAVFYSDDQKGEGSSSSMNADPKTIAFQRLTDPQKKFVKDTYELAYTLFMQQKFDLAEGQLRKIHDMIPEGYEESHKIAEDIQSVKLDRQRIVDIERDRQRIAQNQRMVAETVAKCRVVANRTMSLSEIQSCIAEAITLDPENEQLRGFVVYVQSKIEAEQRKAASRANHAALVARRRALYNNALEADKGDPLTAIAAHQKNVSSNLPDPDDLASRSRQRVAELRGEIDKAVNRGLSEAERLFDAGKLKEAYAALEKAGSVDPGNPRVMELAERIVKDLNQQLKSIYEDSVLEEGLGNVDSAKEKWRKILEIDRPNGEYFRRARNKLRQYGSQ